MSDNREMCANGHFYDKSKYTQCPHCANGMAPIKTSAFTTQAGGQMDEVKKKTEKKGLFGRKKGKGYGAAGDCGAASKTFRQHGIAAYAGGRKARLDAGVAGVGKQG